MLIWIQRNGAQNRMHGAKDGGTDRAIRTYLYSWILQNSAKGTDSRLNTQKVGAIRYQPQQADNREVVMSALILLLAIDSVFVCCAPASIAIDIERIRKHLDKH